MFEKYTQKINPMGSRVITVWAARFSPEEITKELLNGQLQSLLESLEVMRKLERYTNNAFPVVDQENIAYNQALSDISALIRNRMEK